MLKRNNQHSNIPTAEELKPYLAEYRRLGMSYEEMKETLMDEENIDISSRNNHSLYILLTDINQ
jgi:hypothetical protein